MNLRRELHIIDFLKRYPYILLVIILILGFNGTLAANQLEVNYLDVGLGDSILIKSPNDKVILFDGGNKETSVNLKDYLNRNEIKKLDYVISSVPHRNHIGGLLSILEDFEVEKVF